jgi:four helix bundle protein
MSNLKSQNYNAKVKSDIKYRAYKFSLENIKLVETFPNKRIAWIITDQLLRSVTSIGANLIEAKSASPKKDFIKFYEIALKSANESKYWLCLARDAKMTSKEKVGLLLTEAEEISKIIAASLLKLKGKK